MNAGLGEGESDWLSEESAHLMTSSHGNEEAKPEISPRNGEAECNQKVGMAQRLGDVRPPIQGPLIKKNQAKLQPAEKEKEKRGEGA